MLVELYVLFEFEVRTSYRTESVAALPALRISNLICYKSNRIHFQSDYFTTTLRSDDFRSNFRNNEVGTEGI